jgi:hypothetical protein
VEDLESQIAETPKPRDPIQQIDFLTSANDATASSRLLTLRIYRIFQRPLELSRHGLEGREATIAYPARSKVAAAATFAIVETALFIQPPP